MRARRAVLLAVVVGVLLYAAYAVAAVSVHTRLVYPFHNQTELREPGFDAQDVPTDAGPLRVYKHVGEAGAPVVIYFMGNVGALTAFAPMLRHHAEAGRSVVAMGYRGGGGVPGTPSEDRLKADALAAYDALPQLVGKDGPVIVHGYSLGTGLALHVAAERSVDGLILAAPYARLCELMAARSFLPACLVPGVQKWQSLNDARRVTAPSLVLHGTVDGLIPFGHGERVAAALEAAGSDTALVPIELGGHDDLFGKPGYLTGIDAFIEGIAR
ncbi:alpha/beta hydrolase [Sagittula sp. MA-2]|uniref:alpha/beta hydrolase n=1 Tax=Sagittula sp. MA-2 TaxID=3048007 RepID=UPI0024C45214|nr:alpha/beta fold hydrolase [Sagittula sp. MA-2]WHZ33546.1 alpha/beta hydrolase [Sagittula sp. MA-2]